MKLTNKIIIIIILIISLTIILFNTYIKKSSDKIITATEAELKKFTASFLSNDVGYDILNDTNIDNILIINKNEDGEILYVDYNLDRAYEALEIITNVLYERINNLEEGLTKSDSINNLVNKGNNLVIEFPFFIYSKSPILSSLGPKLYAKINFVDTILTNIKSKITDYGFNNALVELFVTIEITEQVMTPVVESEVVVSYDVLVASKVINGRVPEFYGGLINKESANLDIPIA